MGKAFKPPDDSHKESLSERIDTAQADISHRLAITQEIEPRELQWFASQILPWKDGGMEENKNRYPVRAAGGGGTENNNCCVHKAFIKCEILHHV